MEKLGELLVWDGRLLGRLELGVRTLRRSSSLCKLVSHGQLAALSFLLKLLR
jgi:hypothetical protein